jgi:NAD(P)-dependent dehydrogenase (short-subunit alcohol dehydrogenase family)
LSGEVVVLTGGAGILGSRLANALAAQGAPGAPRRRSLQLARNQPFDAHLTVCIPVVLLSLVRNTPRSASNESSTPRGAHTC